MYCSITKSILLLLFDLKILPQANILWQRYSALRVVLVQENPR
jgi:hypothetical protein